MCRMILCFHFTSLSLGLSLGFMVRTVLPLKPDLIIIIIMEICKAPSLRLKVLNKHTHIMCIEMENVI